MRNILCSLGAFWSCHGKIWPISIKIRQEIAYLSTEMKPSGGCFSDEKHSEQSWSLLIMGWEDMADQSSLPNKFRLSFSTGAMKHPPDGFIPVLRDRQVPDGFWSISAISSHRAIRRLQDCAECFSSLFFTFWALHNVQIQVPTRPTSLFSQRKNRGSSRIIKDHRKNISVYEDLRAFSNKKNHNWSKKYWIF